MLDTNFYFNFFSLVAGNGEKKDFGKMFGLETDLLIGHFLGLMMYSCHDVAVACMEWIITVSQLGTKG